MTINLRLYCAADEDAAIDLWQRTWQIAYPQIAFGKRLGWWRARWRDELVPAATIVATPAPTGTVVYTDPAPVSTTTVYTTR